MYLRVTLNVQMFRKLLIEKLFIKIAESPKPSLLIYPIKLNEIKQSYIVFKSMK